MAKRLIMKIFNLSSKQIIIGICVNYGLFILAFFTFGFMSRNKSVVIIHFVLDMVLRAVDHRLPAQPLHYIYDHGITYDYAPGGTYDTIHETAKERPAAESLPGQEKPFPVRDLRLSAALLSASL